METTPLRSSSRLWISALLALVCWGAGSSLGQDRPVTKADYPIGCAVGRQGAIYVLDQGGPYEDPAIFRLDPGDKIAVVYRGSKESMTSLFRPKALVEGPTGDLFVCDPAAGDVWRLSADGKTATPLTGELMETGTAASPQNRYHGELWVPLAITLDGEGNPVVADFGRDGIWRVPATGGAPQEIASVPGALGVAREEDGGFIVLSAGKDQLVRVAPDGKVTPVVSGPLAGKDIVSSPQQVAVAPTGYLVSDNYARTIWHVTRDGQVKPLAQGDPLQKPNGIAVLADGSALVADPGAKALFRVSPEGTISTLRSF